MKEVYLKKADKNLPELNEEIIIPEVSLSIMNKGDEIVLDLGNHYVGYLSFKLNYVDEYIDAPVKLCVKFYEIKRELEDDYSTYKGSLCESWLQEEIINIDFPEEYIMPRRYAARYIKIKVMATPKSLTLSDFKFKSVSSAVSSQLIKIKNPDDEFTTIDSVAVNTLKNCMQRVFEDGPKRDRRLWIGDLRLEALTNYYTYKNMELVRRCLYLFAAAESNDKGFIPAFVYENPKFVQGECYLEDYAMLFVVSACDYYNHTGDSETFYDLLPVIREQMDAIHNTLDDDGIVTMTEGCTAFIDWCENLEKITSLHGVYLYTLMMLVDVLEKLMHDDKNIYLKRYQDALKSAKDILYDENKRLFSNTKDNYQYSVHSTVWMVLGGVIVGENAKEILLNSLNSKDSVKPFTPYMHHYVVEALFKLNLIKEATDHIKKYWGGMIALGADTFYEAYVPDDLDFSPYNDRKVNSMCHAWSCTPAYFIRKYLSDDCI